MKLVFTIGMAIIYTIMGHIISLIPAVANTRGHDAMVFSYCLYVALWLVGVALFYAVFSEK